MNHYTNKFVRAGRRVPAEDDWTCIDELAVNSEGAMVGPLYGMLWL